MRLHLVVPAVAVVIAGMPAAAQVAPGQLRGALLDDANRPVAGARVTIIRPARLARGAGARLRNVSPPFIARGTSDASGNYQLAGLPAATYDVCVEAAGYLTTCEWEQWRRATVAAGASVDHGRLTLTRAAVVTVRLADPLDLLRRAGQFSFPLIAIRDPLNRFHGARKVAMQGNTHIFQVEAPYNTPLTLRIHSVRFRLTDAQGREVGLRGADLPFQAPRDTGAPVFTFTIAGEASQQGWPPRGLSPRAASP
jgi:hypothetical protein